MEEILIIALTIVSSTSVNATLVERLGGRAYYDDVAKLTWLADANYSATQYANSGGTEGDADGLMTWASANNWAANLNIAGVIGWRLPNTVQPDAGCSIQSVGISYGYYCSDSEMGNLFYNVFGGNAGSSTTTTDNANYDLFSNIQSNSYWSSTDATWYDVYAWFFEMNNGDQNFTYNYYGSSGWAVKSGDVSAVPVPAAVWLFGSGLIGLICLAKRKKG